MPKLTKRYIDTVRPSDRDIVLWDDELPRFGLRVKPSGARTYVVQYRNAAGRTRKLALGRVGELTPDEARDLAKDALGDVRRGKDPSASRAASRGAVTVAALCDDYLAAAEKLARTAVFGAEPMKPERMAHQPWFASDAFSKNKSVQFDYDETGMSLPNALHVTQRFVVDGEYKLRCILRGVRPAGSNPVELGFWIDGKLMHETKVPVPTIRENGRAPGEMNGL